MTDDQYQKLLVMVININDKLNKLNDVSVGLNMIQSQLNQIIQLLKTQK
jgi:hypothetical protein